MRLKGVVENIEIFLDLARLHDLFFFFLLPWLVVMGLLVAFCRPFRRFCWKFSSSENLTR